MGSELLELARAGAFAALASFFCFATLPPPTSLAFCSALIRRYCTMSSSQRSDIFDGSDVAAALPDEGDLAGAKAVLVGDWAAADTIQRLSVSDRQKKAAGSFVNAVPTLTGASSLTEAKAAFVSTAGALESWCKLTGYDSVVAGL